MEIIRYISLYDICDFESGVTSLPKNYKENGKYSFLEYKNVYSKKTIFKTDEFLKINLYEKDVVKYYVSHENQIIGTWSSENNSDVFQTVYVNTKEKFIVNGFSKILKIKSDLFLSKWLSIYINFSKSINHIRKSIPFTTRCNMTMSIIKMIKIPIIDLNVQQQIIDIIKPKEELFIKYNKLIRIDNINNFKNDWKVLIDIIEPFELLLEEINQKINKIKNILHLNYVCSYSNEFIKIVDIIKIHNDKYKDQNYYFATNGISEFEIDYSKVIDIREKRPSRANLTPKENSLIFSKLIGENKVLYIDEHNDYVFSTGFYNITTKYIDFVTGFLLSNDFIEQKSKFSNGTTMIGLNLEGLNKIEIKKPKKEGQTLILFMNNLIKQKYFVEKIINGLIEKYIH